MWGKGSRGEPGSAKGDRESNNKAFCFINSLSTTEQVQWEFRDIGAPRHETFFYDGGLDYVNMNSPGQNTGVGSSSLFQGIFPTQGSNPGLLHRRQSLYQLSYQGSPHEYEVLSYSNFE